VLAKKASAKQQGGRQHLRSHRSTLRRSELRGKPVAGGDQRVTPLLQRPCPNHQ
jgi:hypothetical protein